MSGGIGIGTVSPTASKDRIRVRTIVITAPQQEHRNGARGLTQAHHASIRAGSNFSSRCSKAISRLQFGCRNPKLRARRNPLGSTCCNTSHRNCAPGMRGAARVPPEGIAKSMAHLLSLDNVQVEDEAAVRTALKAFEKGVDFADALHAAASAATSRFVTFDSRLAKRAARLLPRPPVVLAE